MYDYKINVSDHKVTYLATVGKQECDGMVSLSLREWDVAIKLIIKAIQRQRQAFFCHQASMTTSLHTLNKA